MGDGSRGDADAADAVAAARHAVRDVLIPGLPAVVQSSARLETSGMLGVPEFGTPAPPSSAGASAAAAAAAVNAAPDRQRAILGLKHLHGLDGLDEGRGRRGERGAEDFDD